MDPNAILDDVRAGLREVVPRVTALVASLPDATAPIRPGTWTVRECAIHLVNEANQAAEESTGAPSTHVWVGKDEHNAQSDARIADYPESDPQKLAGLMTEAADRFMGALARRPGDARVTCYGVGMDLAALAAVYFFDWVMHGYDIATATGRPWSIDPAHAAFGLYGWGPWLEQCVNPETAKGHTAAYAIEMRGAEGVVVRFTDGAIALEPPGSGPVDCVISADPVAFLLVGLGRMTQWQAITCGLLSASGGRPELAFGFLDLFSLP